MSRHTDPALAALERQIAETREELGRTVEELAAKVDVPARARARASQTAARTKARAAHAADRVRHRGGSAAAPAPLPAEQGAEAAAAGAPAEGAAQATAAGGAHPALEMSIRPDRQRRAYGAAAVGLTAATVWAAVWASRRSCAASSA